MAQPGQTYTVRAGDTLDRIISESLGQTPFNQNFLREAFAQMNPKALPQGPRGPLMAGATLRIPDAAGLRRLAFPGEAADTPAAKPAVAASDAAGYVPAAHQSWIRYP
jgi:Tfp pilus assembly protein FimV